MLLFTGQSRSYVDHSGSYVGAQKNVGEQQAKLTATDKRLLVRNTTSGLRDNAVELRQDVINDYDIKVAFSSMIVKLGRKTSIVIGSHYVIGSNS